MTFSVTDEFRQQYDALRQSAIVIDSSQRGEIELSGADCVSFLHNFCTNDIKGLASGNGCEAFFCNLPGKTIGHGYIFRRESTLAIDTVAELAAPLVQHLDRYLIREDVTIVDRSQDVAKLLLAGPRAGELLTELIGGTPIAEMFANERQSINAVANEPFEIETRRIPYLQTATYQLVVDPQRRQSIFDQLVHSGATAGSTDVVETARIEAGTPVFGADITDANLPQELGRDAQTISFKKGCYLGQETVARIDALGHVNRQLAAVRLAGDAIPAIGESLTVDGKDVGQITSAAWSPSLSSVLSLAYLRAAHAQPGKTVECAGRVGEVVATPVC